MHRRANGQAVKEKADRRYMQIADELSRQLASLGPNTLLPTENQLAAEFDVSRVTVRAALHILEQSGSVTRARGRGTIANPQKIVRNAIPMTTVEQDFRSQGIAYETQVLEFAKSCMPPDAIRAALKLPSRASVGRARLLRRVRNKTISYEDRYIVTALARRVTPEVLVNRDVLAFLSFVARSPTVVVEFETEICPAGEEVAKALEISPSTMRVLNTFVHLTDDGRPIEAGSMSYRVDHCKFRAFGRLPLSYETQNTGKQTYPKLRGSKITPQNDRPVDHDNSVA
jgi:GntR family transcriptional regulator